MPTFAMRIRMRQSAKTEPSSGKVCKSGLPYGPSPSRGGGCHFAMSNTNR